MLPRMQGKRKLYSLIGGMQTSLDPMKLSIYFSLTTENRSTCDSDMPCMNFY